MEITAIYNEIHTHRILQLLFTHYEITILIATRQQNRKVLKLVQIPYLTATPPQKKRKKVTAQFLQNQFLEILTIRLTLQGTNKIYNRLLVKLYLIEKGLALIFSKLILKAKANFYIYIYI